MLSLVSFATITRSVLFTYEVVNVLKSNTCHLASQLLWGGWFGALVVGVWEFKLLELQARTIKHHTSWALTQMGFVYKRWTD